MNMREHRRETLGESVLARDQLGAFCRHTHVALAGAPTGLLAGVTFGLKDIYDVAGHKTGFGSPDWLATTMLHQHMHRSRRSCSRRVRCL